MTMIRPKEVECAVCGQCSEQIVALTVHIPDELDLAFRPVGGIFGWGPKECPRCGYVSGSIENASDEERAFVLSDEYQSLRKDEFSEARIKLHVLRAALSERVGHTENMIEAFLSAAGERCDDQSRQWCSKAADALLAELPSREEHSEEARQAILKTADVLRRAQRWDEAINVASEILIRRDVPSASTKLAKFQIKQSKEMDGRWHAMNEVLNLSNVSTLGTY